MHLTYREFFLKDMKAIPRGRLREELLSSIQELKDAENITELLAYHPVKKLRGYSTHYRLRIEGYRLGFRLESDGSLTLLHFRKRSEIYNVFP